MYKRINVIYIYYGFLKASKLSNLIAEVFFMYVALRAIISTYCVLYHNEKMFTFFNNIKLELCDGTLQCVLYLESRAS